MNSQLYNNLIDDSFIHQFKAGLDGHAREINNIAIFTTSLDLGRQTGKTKAIRERVLRDSQRGVYTYYVGHTMDAAKDFASKLTNKVKCMVLSAKAKNFLDATRGIIQAGQAVNIVFDECGLSKCEEHEFIKAVVLQMERGDVVHPFRYIHVIRMGL